MNKKITVASLVMLIGGAVTFLLSFLDFYTFGNDGRSAWSSDLAFPETAIPAILGLAMAVLIVLTLVGVKLPDKVLTFDWKQIYVTIGISAAAIMLGWLFSGNDAESTGVGLIFMLLGSLAMCAGAIMNILGMGANTLNLPSGGSGQQQQQQMPGYQQGPPGYQQPPPPGYQQAPPPPGYQQAPPPPGYQQAPPPPGYQQAPPPPPPG